MDQQLVIPLDEVDEPVDVLRKVEAELQRCIGLMEWEAQQLTTRAANVELRLDSTRRRLENIRAWLSEHAA